LKEGAALFQTIFPSPTAVPRHKKQLAAGDIQLHFYPISVPYARLYSNREGLGLGHTAPLLTRRNKVLNNAKKKHTDDLSID